MSLSRLLGLIVLNIVTLPGGAQWRLKHRKRAAVFVLSTLGVLAGFFVFIVRIVSDQIREIGEMAHTANVIKLSEKLSANIAVEHEIGIKVFTFLLIACYIISIADLIWLYQSQNQK